MNKFRMKQDVWQIIIPLIIISLILQGDLIARRAAQLIVEKTDQKTIEGKLIHVDVKEKSLILNSDNGGIKIYMDEIDTIRVVKRKSFGRYLGKGALIGGGIGAGLGIFLYNEDHKDSAVSRGHLMLGYACIFGLLGLVGGILEVASSPKKTYKEIRVKGKSPFEIKRILKKLKRKALK